MINLWKNRGKEALTLLLCEALAVLPAASAPPRARWELDPSMQDGAEPLPLEDYLMRLGFSR